MDLIEKLPLNAAGGLPLQLKRMDAPLLRNIFEWLDGYDISLLWFTGDRVLRYLMSDGHAVTRFETNYERPMFLLRVAFPHIISNFFGLKTLNLGYSRGDPGILDTFRCPPSLESLNLNFSDCNEFHVALHSDVSILPNLRCLKIIDNTHSWCDDDLAILPPTLEDLYLFSAQSMSGIAVLPRNLTSLYFSATSIVYDAIDCPPNLTKLCISLEEEDETDEQTMAPFVASLPRHLEWLEIYDANGLADCLPVLPPALTRLELTTMPSDSAPNLAILKEVAPRLTHLEVTFLDRIPRSIAGLLSPKLKHLALYEFNFDSGFDISFPPNATFIGQPSEWYRGLDESRFFSAIKQLPRTLTEISLMTAHVSLFTASVVNALPEPLVKLFIPTINDEIALNLPKNLKKLVAGNPMSSLSVLSESAVMSLPTTLKALHCALVHLPAPRQGWVRRLTALREFEVNYPQMPAVTPADFAALPHSLTKLGFQSRGQGIDSEPEYTGKKAWIDAMSHLDRLRHFSFAVTVSDPDMCYGLHMPLYDLIITGFSSEHPLNDEHIKAIKGLKVIKRGKLSGGSICTDQCLPFLPTSAYAFAMPLSQGIAEEKKAQLRSRGITFQPVPHIY